MHVSLAFVGAAALIASPFVGSFVCCFIDRMPDGPASAVWSRSRCYCCGNVLSARDLIPILSYLALRGRCRACGVKIPRKLLVAELSFAALTGCAVLISPSDKIPIATLLAWTLVSLGYYDVVHGRLPDTMTIPLCALGVICAAIYQGSVPTAAIVGALSGILIPLSLAILYRSVTNRNGLGGGDIKLFGASGAWVGWQGLPALLMLSSLSALCVVLAKGRFSPEERVPFGPFIAFTTFAIWCWQISR